MQSKMKKGVTKMNKPELNVVLLNCADVIATSGIYKLTGTDDTVQKNLQFKLPSGSVLNYAQLVTQYESTKFNNGTQDLTGYQISLADEYGMACPSLTDGDYEWDANAGKFVKVSPD